MSTIKDLTNGFLIATVCLALYLYHQSFTEISELTQYIANMQAQQQQVVEYIQYLEQVCSLQGGPAA